MYVIAVAVAVLLQSEIFLRCTFKNMCVFVCVTCCAFILGLLNTGIISVSDIILFILQVWLSFAQFEKSTSDPESVKNARKIYQEATSSLKSSVEKEERLMVLEAWQAFEVGFNLKQLIFLSIVAFEQTRSLFV